MRTRTIRAKITVWFSVLFVVLVTAVLILLLVIGQSVLKTNTKEKLQDLVNSNREELEYLNDDDSVESDEGDHVVAYRDGYLEIDDDFCDYRDGMYVSLYYEGELIYGENPIAAYPDTLSLENGKLRALSRQGEKYFVYDVKVQEADLDGLWLRGVVSEQEGVSMLLRISRFMLLALPVLAFIAVLGGYLIARRALQPLNDICDRAASINSGSDLTKRIEIQNESTETKQLADTFNQMFERLLQSFEAQKQFTSDASHELRTPVSVILAECEYALGEEDAAEWREALEVIARQGSRMSDLIEELLLFTRMERGTVKLCMEQTDLTAVAQEVCREQSRIWKREIAMHAEGGDPCFIEADEKLLARLVTNLVANAYKYGKEPGNIWVRVYREDGRAVLSVRDDGIGIRPCDLDKIWNRFYRADNARGDETSTGLGLSIVREIARIHQAEVKVISEIGVGSTFLIFF